jgi:hypothetical protein
MSVIPELPQQDLQRRGGGNRVLTGRVRPQVDDELPVGDHAFRRA